MGSKQQLLEIAKKNVSVSMWIGCRAPMVNDFPSVNLSAFLRSIDCQPLESKFSSFETLISSNRKSLIAAGIAAKPRKRVLQSIKDYKAGALPRYYPDYLKRINKQQATPQ
mmetsp:Transcript_1000/g.1894  ORF Transcript_1000/g.1894 Transcript_1000/m.1894 type:complete len:111 (+) Transcript_1000:14-346(+)